MEEGLGTAGSTSGLERAVVTWPRGQVRGMYLSSQDDAVLEDDLTMAVLNLPLLTLLRHRLCAGGGCGHN